MKIIAFSDLHAHPFKEGKINEDGLNTRLVDCLDTLDVISEYAEENEIDLILFGGDLFHTRKRVDTSAFNSVYAKFQDWQKNGLVTILLPGNHDQYDRLGGIHSLEPFERIARVVSEPKWYVFDEVGIYAIPFIHNTKAFLKALQEGIKSRPSEVEFVIGLFHIGIDKTKIGQGRYSYVLDADVALKDLQPDLWDVVLLGHYHTPQKLSDNVWYIGAPLQHGWVDEGEDRGFMVIDTDSGEVERVTLISPKFVSLPIDKVNFKADKIDFVRVLYDKEDVDKVEELKEQFPNIVAVKVNDVKQQQQQRRANINLASSKVSILKEYVQYKGSGNFSSKALLKLGKKLIE